MERSAAIFNGNSNLVRELPVPPRAGGEPLGDAWAARAVIVHWLAQSMQTRYRAGDVRWSDAVGTIAVERHPGA